MNKIIGVVLLLFSFSAYGEGLFFELGAGYDEHVPKGSNPQSVVRLRYEAPENSWWQPDVLEYNHNSSVMNGRPFNDRPERNSDQFSIIWRFKLL